VALTDSVALVDAAVGLFAKCLMNFKAALTSSAVLSGGSLGAVLGRLLSSELDRERERFGMVGVVGRFWRGLESSCVLKSLFKATSNRKALSNL
jgi:hypothetical protein